MSSQPRLIPVANEKRPLSEKQRVEFANEYQSILQDRSFQQTDGFPLGEAEGDYGAQ